MFFGSKPRIGKTSKSGGKLLLIVPFSTETLFRHLPQLFLGLLQPTLLGLDNLITSIQLLKPQLLTLLGLLTQKVLTRLLLLGRLNGVVETTSNQSYKGKRLETDTRTEIFLRVLFTALFQGLGCKNNGYGGQYCSYGDKWLLLRFEDKLLESVHFAAVSQLMVMRRL